MPQTLVIVESPAKARTIGKFLGSRYHVKASMGHIRDLPKSQIGVDIEHDYAPKYITIRGKGGLIAEIKKDAKKSDRILLATDPDREGEAISWHLANVLGLDSSKKCRIEFHEITKDAIKSAVKNPRSIDIDLVDAQQARRILDRLVGYQISPILWKNIKYGLSAGRVQSVAVKMICDREDEISSFVPEEYWSITANLLKHGIKTPFQARFYGDGNGKIQILNGDEAQRIVSAVKDCEFKVLSVKKTEKKRYPSPPFTTSSMQQEANRKLGFPTKKTMGIAQQLYEGIEVGGEGTVGLITYMRTDSTHVADVAVSEARRVIEREFGNQYLPKKVRVYKSKKGAQEAHEAIRPTSMDRNPDSIKDSLSPDQYKLYKLIWNRFFSSQMSDAVFEVNTVMISSAGYIFRATGSDVVFPGFTSIYDADEGDDEQNKNLPELKEGEILKLRDLEPKQHFTQPPARYTEASLVKGLEENGIGRPSTYAPIISTILGRKYVERERKFLKPTELGKVVNDVMCRYFNGIVNVEFTADLENSLDGIEEGSRKWVDVVDEFYKPFRQDLNRAEQEMGKVALEEEPPEVTDIKCEKCGRNMVVKRGRYGKFLACPGYPECKNTKPLVEELGVRCPKCGGKIIVRRSKKGRTFYGCSNYPSCNFVSWDEPTDERCPKCGNMMVRKHQKNGGTYLLCTNGGCKNKVPEKKDEDGDKIEG